MQIIINIPKEFENHFNSDRFEDSLQRVRFDIHKAIIAKKDILSGNYEIEILDMLTETFLKGKPLPKGHGDLIYRKSAEAIFKNARKALYEQSRKEQIKDFHTREMMLLNAEQFVHLIEPIIEADKDGEDE